MSILCCHCETHYCLSDIHPYIHVYILTTYKQHNADCVYCKYVCTFFQYVHTYVCMYDTDLLGNRAVHTTVYCMYMYCLYMSTYVSSVLMMVSMEFFICS